MSIFVPAGRWLWFSVQIMSSLAARSPTPLNQTSNATFQMPAVSGASWANRILSEENSLSGCIQPVPQSV